MKTRTLIIIGILVTVIAVIDLSLMNDLRYTENPNECWVQDNDGTFKPCVIDTGGWPITFSPWPEQNCDETCEENNAIHDELLENYDNVKKIENTPESKTVQLFLQMYPNAKQYVDDKLNTVSYRLDLESNRTEIVSEPYIILQVFMPKNGEPQEIRLDCSDGVESHVSVGQFNVETFLDARVCENAIPELKSAIHYEFSSKQQYGEK